MFVCCSYNVFFHLLPIKLGFNSTVSFVCLCFLTMLQGIAETSWNMLLYMWMSEICYAVCW